MSQPSKEELHAWLLNELAARSGIDPRAIDAREPFSRYGLDSRGAAELLAALGAALGRSLPATLVWEHPTPAALSRYLAGDPAESAPQPQPQPRERASSGGAEDEPVAIVGLACRFPRAPNADAYWRLLADRVDAIAEIPPDRWNGEALFDRELDAVGKMNTRWGGFLDRIDEFEPLFFGISPKEALHMDPQQRLMLELAWEALEDAGLPADRLQGSKTGVFCGVVWTDYATLLQRGGFQNIGQHTVTGFHHSIVANRISYTLGLEGPSVSLDTACSSSLVAVHLACESLRRGESALALAGGVNLNLVPESTMGVSKFGALSPDGRCFTFDARANGYVRGEGAGLVVLKPLSRALADGDRIYCVIRGSAVNNDGASNGLTAPNPRAQEAVLRAAYERAAVDPADVQYVEAHGTGTQLGDPIEARALGAVLGAGAGRTPDRPLRVGSSKTNIGHLEAAAGVAALIKAALCIQRRALPPSLHFETPNPLIPFDALRLEVQHDLGPWPEPERPLTAGVSAFGFGGTNCHVVLQEWRASRAELLALAAPSPQALRAAAEQLAARLASPGEDEPLPALCQSAAERHRDGAHRLAATARSRSELRQQLEGFLAGERRAGLSTGPTGPTGHAEPARFERPVFVFSGQGSQWLGMGRILAQTEPVFRAALERCDELVQRFLGWSLLDELNAGEAASRLDRIDVTCPVIVSIEIALAALWRSWGVEPCAVVGHSIGEVAAAHVAGVLDLEDAMRVICTQGAIIHRLRGRGAMGLVALSWEQAGEALAGHEQQLCRAIHMSPDSTVLSGEPAALDALLETLQRRGIFCRRVAVDVAAHSAQLDPLRGELHELLREVRPRRERVPIVSTVTASPLAGRSFDASHWVKNLADPVLFSGAIEHLAREGHALFVEVSPHPLVTRAVESILGAAGRPGAIFASLRRHEDDRAAMLDTLGALFARGQTIEVRELVAVVARDPSPAREEGGAGAAAQEEPAQLLPLSARSPEALAALALDVRSALLDGAASGAHGLRDIAYSACVRRSHLRHRLAVVGRSAAEVAEALDLFARGEARPGLAHGAARPGERPRTAFVFSGQGSQWAGMGRALLDQEPAFRAALEACDALLEPRAGFSLLAELAAPEGRSRLDQTEVAQPALFAVQVALAALLRSWGIAPDLVIGHSVGEIAAAHVAGILSLEEATRLVAARGRVMQQATGRGRMVQVALSADDAARALHGFEGRLSIAAVNSPGSVVLSGDGAALAEVIDRLAQQGVRGRMLRVDYAFHSVQMAPLEDELSRALGRVEAGRAAIPMISTVTGAAVDGPELDAAYWARSIGAPVQFSGAVGAAIEAGHRVFLEVGPHPVLSADVLACLEARGTEGHALPSMRRAQDERRCLLQALGALYALGAPPAFSALFPSGGRCVALPAYPWQRQRYWPEGSTAPEASAPADPAASAEAGNAASAAASPGVEAAASPGAEAATRPANGRAALPGAWADRLRALASGARAAEVEAAVRADVARMLALPPAAIPDDRPLRELGMDSLMAVQLRAALAARVGQPLPSTLAFDHPTVAAIARYLLDRALPAAAPRAAASPGDALRDEPIAIVGAGCRFPGGARDPASFWRLLEQEVDAIREVPGDRWDIDAFYDPDPDAKGKMTSRWGGFLDELDRFDAAFFGISPREAASIDPQQRLLLEVTWEALEDAGQTLDQLMGSDTGVYIGIGSSEYQARALSRAEAIDAYSMLGTVHSTTVGRLSYWLGLKGPNLPVDTACSSSLVAVHLACQALRSGECSMAIAGGVNVTLTPEPSVFLSRLRALSPTGRCRAFSADADGYVRSEGCGLFVLKRLADARRDGDRILAIIRGSAVNQDGRSNGLTAPNGPSQEAVLRRALEQARVSPAAVGYVETHGTGTPLGDPIEVHALAAVLGEGRAPDRPVVLGSVKTNIGHAEAAAGAAGLLKAALALRHGLIPRTLHVAALNPHVPWAELAVRVAAEPVPWPESGAPRVAGVSSFGFSGTNAHVVLEEAPAPGPEPPAGAEARPPALAILPLSAQRPEALAALAEAYRGFLTGAAAEPTATIEDIAYTAGARRSHLAHRLAVVGRSREAWAEALAAFAAGEPHEGLFQAEARLDVRPRVVFVFPGQGSQWLGMGRELLRDEPVFRAAIEACERAMRPHVDWSLAEELGAEEGRSQLDRVDVVQPLLFAMQVALAALWRAWGVEPHAVVGHSMGEIAAAHVAGSLGLEDAVRIICRRSRLVRRASGQGGMAVVELDLEQAEQALAGHEARLSIAASNGPRSTVLSGDTEALDHVVRGLEQRGVFCRRVKVDYASHSPQMDPLTDDLLRELEGIAPRPAALPICSTVTGRIGDGSDFDPAYWARNLRAPVLFRGAIEQLLEGGHGVFIEVSAHPVLLASIEETRRAAGRPALALASLRRQAEERASVLGSLAALYAHGGEVDWRRFHEGRGRLVALPSYPWQRERHWLDEPAEPARRARAGEADGHPLLGGSLVSSVQPGARFWERSVSVEELPYLADHRVQGEVVFPGAGYVEMAFAAGAEVFSAGLTIEGLTIEAMLAVPEGRPRTVQLALIEEGAGRASFQIASRAEGEESYRRHATGTLRPGDGRAPEGAAEPPARLAERLGAALDPEAAYRRRQAQGLDYGPAFRGIRQLWRGDGEALARVSLPEEAARGTYQVHPALLDACFQVAAELVEDGEGPCVPVAIARAQAFSSIGRDVWVRARAATAAGDGDRAFDLALVSEEGRLVASIEGLKVRRLDAGQAAADELDACVYTVAWRRAEPPREPPRAEGSARGAWLLLADRSGTGEALEALLGARGERCVRVEAGRAYARAAADRYTIDPAAREDYRRLLGDAFGEEGSCRGVVHLFSLDAAPFEATTPRTLDADLRRGSVSAAYLAQAIVRQGFRDVPRLWLVTRAARAVASDPHRGAVEAAQAPLWGLGQTIATEHPELACSRVDLDPAPSARDAELLARELGAAAQDDQIGLRGGERYVAQLVRSRFEDGEPPGDGRRAEPAQGRPFRLEIDEPGVLERLALREIRRRPPGPGEVEIAVDAAGLNFLDVMKALGIYPGMAPGPVALGNECAGRVVAVGEGVRGLAIGQEVIAVAPGAFATHVTAPARAVVPKPARLTPAQAAAIPSVFMTAWYALNHLGRARHGERVLIHAASGGTGLAGIQIARALGLEVFATAGSEEKRAFLRSLGVAHVMDSRTLSFADEILRATGGRGVDLVLNSLTGEAAQKSFEVLAPYGRFLELGKRDIHDNVRLGLAPFKKSLSYSSIDLAGMAEERPELFASLLAEVARRFEEGAFEPLPIEIVPASAAEEAFRRMAQAKHIGKLAIAMDDPEARVVPAADRAPAIRDDASYLVTGGLGALGLAAARWLVEQGARHLVLVGRRAPSDEARAAIGALEAAGARVRAEQADVASDDEVRRLVAELEATMPPLRGVVHAAGLLDDHTLLELSEEHFRRVCAPKVHGAFNLHARTLGAPLDFFVMYSSLATTLGSPGQGNYAAANAFLDALAQRRRSMGLPAMSIAWGAFAEVGLAAADDLRGARVAQRGVGGFSPAEGLAALARLLERPRAEVVVARFEARKWVEFYPSAGASPFLAELLKEAPETSPGAAASTALRESLSAEPPAERLGRLEEHIREQVGRVLRLPAARVGRLAPFRSLGVDSLMSLELRNRIEASVGLRLSTTLLFAYPHAAALSEHLLERLGLRADETTSAPDAGAPEPEAEAQERRERALDQLSDEALASLLAEKLLTA
ncbi:SDR family NAD(P)-dependent oxidoreductase [Sorangium sp. So ce1078]|uniref:SDR family NAD(P)-dependent oxidoreductase n=1 Tax=Sorangium sp. So ce1078 TaxID=3133329 RepID=UPI003F5E95E8